MDIDILMNVDLSAGSDTSIQSRGAKVDQALQQSHSDQQGFNEDNVVLFRKSIIENDLDTVKDLHAKGMDLEALDNYAIKEASENGYEEMVEYLCENGVDVTAQDNISAIKAGREENFKIVHILVQHGASIEKLSPNVMQGYNQYIELSNRMDKIEKFVKAETEFAREVRITCQAIKEIKARNIPQISGLKI